MNARIRTLLGVALFLPLAAILLGTYACLPAPVGDPATAKVDPQITGAYEQAEADKGGRSVALLRPWDDHTYLFQNLQSKVEDGKESQLIYTYKAWLTTIGDRTFICCQPMNNLTYVAADPNAKPFWLVLRLDKTATGLEVRLINYESELMKNLTTRDQIEAAIKAHVTDQALYGQPMNFKKLGAADVEKLSEFMTKFNISSAF